MRKVVINDKGQAVAPQSQSITKQDFLSDHKTRIYWLGGAGIMVHSHQINIMIDPVLEGFDIPLLYQVPVCLLLCRQQEKVLQKLIMIICKLCPLSFSFLKFSTNHKIFHTAFMYNF